MPHASFDGLRVLSLESRRAREVEKLIRTYNGEPTVVPAMRELPLSSNTACLEFGRRLLAGDFDIVLFLTGVGVRTMMTILEAEMPREAILDALSRTAVVARGAKPGSVLRELEIPVTAVAPDPSTWREVVATMEETFGEALAHKRLAVQEYGASNPELLAELVNRCAQVTKVPVYQWGLPLDLEPLREAIRSVIRGDVDVFLFMTAVQVIHLFQVATEMGVAEELRRGLNSSVIVSIGPTTTEELQHYRVRPDFEPSRPKMGFMVNEAAQYAGRVLAAKRTGEISPGHISTRAVPQVASSTSTMAGFLDGLIPSDATHAGSNDTVAFTSTVYGAGRGPQSLKDATGAGDMSQQSTIPADDLTRALALVSAEDPDRPHLGLVGDTYTVLLSGKDTAGRFCLIDMHIPPGGGPSPHRHDFEESFIVLDGEIEATFRGETSTARAGQTLHIPANAPHHFRNTSGAPARLLCICSPAGQEDFFAEIGVPVATRITPPPPLSESEQTALVTKAKALAPKYKSELL